MTRVHHSGYAALLAQIQPCVPHSRAENDRMLAQAERLMLKGEENLSPAENAILELLLAAIHEYEGTRHQRRKSTPAEMLAYLMEENGQSPADLPLPASRVSEILSGTRDVSKDQAKRLGEFFHVSPALFI